MLAMTYERYGPPDVLRAVDIAVPQPAPGQVLVKIAATSINLSDCEALIGRPAYARLGGLRSPRHHVLGSDIAGVVEAVGPGVTEFHPGDEVYGDNLGRKGGFAEYALAPSNALAPKPAALSFEHAAALPQAGAIAWHGTAELAAGSRLLINGAGGGSGSFAIQLAKQRGAHVTAVDNEGKLDFMRRLGADEIIDYRREDFTRVRPPYDAILDMVAHRSVFAIRRALAPGGRYRCVGGAARSLVAALTAGAALGTVTGRSIGVLVVSGGPAQFTPVAERVVAGEIDVHIDRVYPLAELPAALRRVGGGRALGKVIVTP